MASMGLGREPKGTTTAWRIPLKSELTISILAQRALKLIAHAGAYLETVVMVALDRFLGPLDQT